MVLTNTIRRGGAVPLPVILCSKITSPQGNHATVRADMESAPTMCNRPENREIPPRAMLGRDDRFFK